MEDSDTASPTFSAQTGHMSSSISPAIPPQDDRHRQHSYSSVSTGYSYSASASPAFGPQVYGGYASAPTSALTSPALNPQNELDQEAMAALLMLNSSDRRKGRGLSVRDLLST